MNTRQITNQIRTTLAVLERLEGKMDKSAATALADAMVTADKVRDWQRDLDALSPAAAVLDALAAGRDPLDDPAVLRALTGSKLVEMMGGIDARTALRVASVATDHIAAIVHAFDTPYDQATERLTAARAVLAPLGIDQDTDPGVILSRGVVAATAWTETVTAIDVHARIRNALAPLVGVLGLSTPIEPVMFVDPAGHTLVDLRALGRKPHPFAVLDAGMSLSLAGPAEAQERIDAALENGDNHARTQQADADEAWSRGTRSIARTAS